MINLEPKFEIKNKRIYIIIIVQSAIQPTINWSFGSTKITKTSKRYVTSCTQQSEGTYQVAMEVKEVSKQKETQNFQQLVVLTLKVLVATIDAQWEGMGDVRSARY